MISDISWRHSINWNISRGEMIVEDIWFTQNRYSECLFNEPMNRFSMAV